MTIRIDSVLCCRLSAPPTRHAVSDGAKNSPLHRIQTPLLFGDRVVVERAEGINPGRFPQYVAVTARPAIGVVVAFAVVGHGAHAHGPRAAGFFDFAVEKAYFFIDTATRPLVARQTAPAG